MNKVIKPIFYLLLIITFLVGNKAQVFGQKKVNLTTGIGNPELLYLGVYYELDQIQMGVSVGTIPADTKPLSISGDVFYHFGGTSELSKRRPWYVRLGLNYIQYEGDNSINDFFNLNIRIGRDFNLSNKLGIRLDAGTIFKLRKKETTTNQIIQGGGVGLFYRI